MKTAVVGKQGRWSRSGETDSSYIFFLCSACHECRVTPFHDYWDHHFMMSPRLMLMLIVTQLVQVMKSFNVMNQTCAVFMVCLPFRQRQQRGSGRGKPPYACFRYLGFMAERVSGWHIFLVLSLENFRMMCLEMCRRGLGMLWYSSAYHFLV